MAAVRKEIDPQDLVAQEEAQAKTAEARERSRKQEVEDFKWLMNSMQGRRIVWRLLEKAGLFHCVFQPDSETQFANGMRNSGVMLMADIHEICPDKYHLMVKERNDNDDRS